MTVYWITKYALTSGIQAETKADVSTMFPDLLRVGVAAYHGEGREWHRTREAAVARAEEMRTAKIKSVEKQLERLRKMEF